MYDIISNLSDEEEKTNLKTGAGEIFGKDRVKNEAKRRLDDITKKTKIADKAELDLLINKADKVPEVKKYFEAGWDKYTVTTTDNKQYTITRKDDGTYVITEPEPTTETPTVE